MLRATILTPNLSLGGAERWIVSLVKYSDPQKIVWDSVVVGGWGGVDTALSAELSQYTTLACNHPGFDRPAYARPFDLRHFRSEHIYDDLPTCLQQQCRDSDVLLTWGAARMDTWCGGLQLPIVLCSHTTQKETANHAIGESVTHLVGVSDRALNYFRGRPRYACYADNKRTAVISNGADPQRVVPQRGREAIRESWGVGDNDVVIGYLGRQSVEKNFTAAASTLFSLPANCKAVYYGTDDTGRAQPHAQLVQLQQRLGNRLILRQPQTDVGDVLAGFDVVMLASHREACSLTLLEAWLASVPVIATPVGSVPEMTEKHGEVVVSVPKSPTRQDLVNAVIVASSAKGAAIAARARVIAEREYTCDRMAGNWADYLQSVADGS